jgi:hypothetical protein
MLWYKAWLETRWRFVIGLVILICSAAGTVFSYPRVQQLMPLVPDIDASTTVGAAIREATTLARSYRGYVWSQVFRQNLMQMVTLFAALLGTGNLLAQSSGGALFTLSLPASRGRVLGVRAATGLAELFVLAVAPALAVTFFSPAIAQSYGIGDAVVHALCQFVVGAVFFSLAFLLSTMFGDMWRPLLIACAVASALAIASAFTPELSRFSPFRVMSGETYFRGGGLPWLGLAASLALSAAMLYAAARNIEHTDF